MNNNMRILEKIKGNIENLLENEKKIIRNEEGTNVKGIEFNTENLVFELENIEPDSSNETETGNKESLDETSRSEKSSVVIKSYAKILQNPLIERRDVFDFVSITKFAKNGKGNDLSMLYINDPKGQIISLDSLEVKYTSKSIFEIDFGYNQYKSFNISYLNDEDYNIFLTGYISKDVYDDKKREVSIYLISSILILTVLLIHALPFMKLWVMSHSERLSLKDIFLTGVSISLLPTVLILVIMFFTYHFGHIGTQTEKNLEDFHSKIIQNFNSELTNITNLLGHIRKEINSDTVKIDSSNFTRDLSNLEFFKNIDTIHSGKANINYYAAVKNFKSNSLPHKIDKNSSYKYFNSIFWCDPNGKIRIYLSNEKEPNLIYDLSHRNYVMDIPNKNTFKFNGENISFESIRSVSDGNYEMGLGLESGVDSLPVLATSLSLVSIMNPILEEGYGFCFFDHTGKTIFHSDKNRNLNENFLEETNNTFNYNLATNSSSYDKISYMDKEHYMYMNKVHGFDDIYLATFLDSEYVDTSNSLAISSTIVFQVIFLAILLFLSIVLFSTTGKFSLIRQKRFLFFWLRPYTDDTNMAKDLYGSLLSMNILGILYLILNWVFYQNNIRLLIFSIISTCIIIIIFNFWSVTKYLLKIRNQIAEHFSIFRNNIFKYFMVTFIIFIMIIKIRLPTDSSFYLFVDMVLLGLFISNLYNLVVSRRVCNLFKKIYYIFSNQSFSTDIYSVYKLFILSLLFLITLMPPIIFYSIAQRVEDALAFRSKIENIDFKIKNWEFEKKSQFISEKDGRLVSNIEDIDDFIDQMKIDSLSFLFFNSCRSSVLTLTDSAVRDTTKSESKINQKVPFWYANFRLPFNQYGQITNAFIGSDTLDSELFKVKDAGLFLLRNDLMDVFMEEPIGILYPSFIKNLPLFFLFILLVCILYLILNFTINKIYGLDFYTYAKRLVFNNELEGFSNQLGNIYSEIDKQRRSAIQELGSQKSDQENVSLPGFDAYNNIFFTGVNASHISHLYHNLKSRFPDQFFSMDMLLVADFCEDLTEPKYKNDYFIFQELNCQINLSVLFNASGEELSVLRKAIYEKPDLGTSSTSHQLIIFIEHFEFSYENIELNKIKLGIIRRLISNSAIRVIICSEISLMKIHEYYEDQIRKFKVDFKKDSGDYIEKRKLIDDITNDYRKWLHLFGSFYNITIPLEANDKLIKDAGAPFPFLKSELNHGTYLRKINLRYQKDLDNSGQLNRSPFTEISDEELILNIQEIAYPYYFSVWNSLSKQEQYIVYDIAMDGFVNPNNVNGILELLHKGILVYDDSLRLMNASFTNFVLTKVDSDITLKNDLASKENGNWSVTSSVFLMVILGLILFVSFGKIHVLDDMNALLGSIAAVFTLLLRLSGIFSFSKE